MNSPRDSFGCDPDSGLAGQGSPERVSSLVVPGIGHANELDQWGDRITSESSFEDRFAFDSAFQDLKDTLNRSDLSAEDLTRITTCQLDCISNDQIRELMMEFCKSIPSSVNEKIVRIKNASLKKTVCDDDEGIISEYTPVSYQVIHGNRNGAPQDWCMFTDLSDYEPIRKDLAQQGVEKDLIEGLIDQVHDYIETKRFLVGSEPERINEGIIGSGAFGVARLGFYFDSERGAFKLIVGKQVPAYTAGSQHYMKVSYEIEAQRAAARAGLAVPIHDWVSHEGTDSIIMDPISVDGFDMQRVIDYMATCLSDHPQFAGTVFNFLTSFINTLFTMIIQSHEDQEIAHGDIKPDNVAVDKKLGVKLLDWGESQSAKSKSPHGGTVEYLTLAYLERYEKPAKENATFSPVSQDAYAVGMVMIFLLFGNTPQEFKGVGDNFDSENERDNFKQAYNKIQKNLEGKANKVVKYLQETTKLEHSRIFDELGKNQSYKKMLDTVVVTVIVPLLKSKISLREAKEKFVEIMGPGSDFLDALDTLTNAMSTIGQIEGASAEPLSP